MRWKKFTLVLEKKKKEDFEKKIVKYLALTIYWTQRKNMTNQYIFF